MLPPPGEEEVSYLTLLKNRDFRRLFLAQAVSSLGDWTGVIAIAVFAQKIGGTTAVGAVMTARVLPGFLVGPLAGVIADRWDRRKTMITADVARGLIIFSLPFVPNLMYLLIASVFLESLTLVWGPAKDASLPNFVSPGELTHANSLSLIGVYGSWPLSSILFAALAPLGAYLGSHVEVLSGLSKHPESVALWVDSLTFAFSAAMVAGLTIPSSRHRGPLDLGEIKRDLFEGLAFIRDSRQVRPWLLGIGLTFTAAGAVLSLGPGFVRTVLGAGDSGFAFLIGFLATGMLAGLLSTGFMARHIHKDVLFSSAILLSGIALVALASVSSLGIAIPIATSLGFFGGTAYSTGYSLIHESTVDEMRGRTFSAAYTVIRLGMLVGLGIFPFVAGALGDHVLRGPFGPFELAGTRTTLWLAGAVASVGGVLSMRAIGARAGPKKAPGEEPGDRAGAASGYFIVLEGGEGAGKTTQIDVLAQWLEARGDDVVTTREPGGTQIGGRIRSLLLDDEASEMDPRAEALLYAADRAQHVAEIVRPALEAGKIVVSDRFVDSSLAYQGLARGLGLEEIYELSNWATGGLLPDLVLFLNVKPGLGLGRAVRTLDRMERQGEAFHNRVSAAYLEIAERFPERFVVIDGSRSEPEVHRDIVTIVEQRTSFLHARAEVPRRRVPPSR